MERISAPGTPAFRQAKVPPSGESRMLLVRNSIDAMHGRHSREHSAKRARVE